MKKLTAKQEVFCKEYVKDRNATQAAVRAGYSEHTAQVQSSRLLAQEEVHKRVQVLLQAQQERQRITADYVLMQAVEVYERCMQAVAPVMKRGSVEHDEAGNAVYAFDVKGALAALELIGKHVAVAAFKEGGKSKVGVREGRAGISTGVDADGVVIALGCGMAGEDGQTAFEYGGDQKCQAFDEGEKGVPTPKEGQAEVVWLSDAERAARVAKILAMAQARRAMAQGDSTEQDACVDE